MKKYTLFALILLAITFAYISCKHEIPVLPNSTTNELPNSVAVSCSPDSVYFANTIQPLLTSGCAMTGCHDAGSHRSGINLTTYSGVMKIVVPGSANNSNLYRSMLGSGEDRMPPRPATLFTTDQLTKISKWINQGAKNNACSSCDSTNFKFSTAIKPMIENKCQGCHNPNSLGGGIDLSTYAGIKSAALSGKLFGAISWANGFSNMPQNSKLPACEIGQIKKWIDAGSLNN